MEYSLFVVLDDLDDLHRGLQPYNLSEQIVDDVLRLYGEVLRLNNDTAFRVEYATSPSVFNHRASDIAEGISDDWDVSKPQTIYGVRRSTQEFVVLMYEPKVSYIQRLSGYLKYISDQEGDGD